MYSSPYFIISAAVTWLKYCRYGVKHKSINQLINVLFLEMFVNVFYLALYSI